MVLGKNRGQEVWNLFVVGSIESTGFICTELRKSEFLRLGRDRVFPPSRRHGRVATPSTLLS